MNLFYTKIILNYELLTQYTLCKTFSLQKNIYGIIHKI